MNKGIIKKYKTWVDKETGKLVTWNPYWKKQDKEKLIYVGTLQPNQNPFYITFDGYIFRELYGKRFYYYWLTEGELLKTDSDGIVK